MKRLTTTTVAAFAALSLVAAACGDDDNATATTAKATATTAATTATTAAATASTAAPTATTAAAATTQPAASTPATTTGGSTAGNVNLDTNGDGKVIFGVATPGHATTAAYYQALVDGASRVLHGQRLRGPDHRRQHQGRGGGDAARRPGRRTST